MVSEYWHFRRGATRKLGKVPSGPNKQSTPRKAYNRPQTIPSRSNIGNDCRSSRKHLPSALGPRPFWPATAVQFTHRRSFHAGHVGSDGRRHCTNTLTPMAHSWTVASIFITLPRYESSCAFRARSKNKETQQQITTTTKPTSERSGWMVRQTPRASSSLR